MKRGPQKYPKELIRSAIKKREEGASLTSIAKDMGIAKTTVKYWLDNPSKFLAETSFESPTEKITRVQGQILDYTWRYAFHLCKKLQEKENDATFRDIVFGINQLVDVLGRVQVGGGHHPVTSPVVEVSEETSVTIRRFLEKKKEMESPPIDETETILGGEPPFSRPDEGAAAEAEASEASTSTENRANG